ncbi:MAG: DUF4476 domain-containing protein [Ferruginibacter sp.]|nr:DUF4476 domain-containing protein [Ferruginibacter sp.]
MKPTLHLITLLLLCTVAQAQQNYFVYIQTDNKQPFYVKMNDKVMSSSASGYVVIPKLSTGSYSLNIGFPKDQWAQQNVPLVINKSDAGYLLKNFGEKGWGLYNLQTMEVTMNGATAPVKQSTTGNDDVFANTLSGAANTDVTVVKKGKPVEPVKTAVTPAVIKVAEVKAEEVKTVKEIPVNKIKKINSSNDVDGKSATYVDISGSSNDTINIFIPVEAKPAAIKAEVVKIEAVKTEAVKTEVVKKEVEEKDPVKDTKFLDIDMQNPNTKMSEKVVPATTGVEKPVTETIKKTEQPIATNKPVVNFNSDCKTNADENDFLKIRKKMAAASGDDGMVSAAAKFLKSTCFTVDQIKNLSMLFLNDAGKYKFFDAAYPRISDTQNFASLQSQLTDEYYVTRFKAMIHN